MSNVVLWVVLTVALTVLATAAALWEERRTARKYESLRCPGCGIEFGPGTYTTWHSHTRLSWRCRWESGPYLRCNSCRVAFRYRPSGELHPEQFDEEAMRCTRQSG